MLIKFFVDNLLKWFMSLVFCFFVEFNKYEVLELVDVLKNVVYDFKYEKEVYYCLVFEMLWGKFD